MADRDHDVQIAWASERHLRLWFGAADSQQAQTRIHTALAAIEQARLSGLLGITPAYATIVLEFDLGLLDGKRALDDLRRSLAARVETPEPARTPITDVPVCYEASCAPDAEELARLHGLDARELIRLHSQPLYVVHFIGFAPGFAYLGGLPKQLATPRLATPRVRVPAGSVGIAGEQSGIYPRGAAGGWRLIGRTPLVMFDARREKPCLLAAGDRVRFAPISLAEFNAKLRGPPDDE